MENSSSVSELDADSGPRTSSTKSFKDAKEALAAFAECSAGLSEFVESLHSSNETLQRDTDSLRGRVQRLTDDLSRFRGQDEQLEKQKLVLAEAERRRLAQDESLRSAQDELSSKTEALNALRIEYKDLLDRINSNIRSAISVRGSHSVSLRQVRNHRFQPGLFTD